MQVCKDIEVLGGTNSDCNIYLVDGTLLVDAGTGNYFGDTKKEIELLGAHPKTLVNTHCHFDHIGGNKKFRDWLKLEIAVHPADRKAVETGEGALAEMFGHTYRIMTVDRLLRNGSTIKTKNFNFEVISTPGHTPGSICLYDKTKKILISGDTVFDGAIGRTDLGGDKEQMIDSLKKLSQLEVDYLLPGHGSPKIGGVNFMIKQMLHLMTTNSMI
ncbi:MAG TPA: MBL fold metallo-hydrolase [archaeon]|nr:MBL fold metallo-hydrolase [archaeon]